MADGLLGAIEGGGTKFVLAVGTADGAILARHVIPTLDPATTLDQAGAWLERHSPLTALGIATFGPVELDPGSARWGSITDTPKPGWSNCAIASYFAQRLGVAVGFDTDVNGAALAEFTLGAGVGASGLAYVTVGTGIGGGLVLDGRLVHGAGHPEIGHLYPRRDADDRDFPGHCPFHGDCLEGLASGPAILARWGASLSDLPPGHVAHERVATYLAQLCHTLFASCAVERVVLGGGVMKAPGLLDRIRQKAETIGGNYLPGRDRQRIAAPLLGDDAGIKGALLIAAQRAAPANR